MKNKRTKEDTILLIQQKAEELGRFPKKSDFDTQTVNLIKSFFGPWPRALEAAGIKEPNQDRIARKRERRMRARENQIRYRKEHPKDHSEAKGE